MNIESIPVTETPSDDGKTVVVKATAPKVRMPDGTTRDAVYCSSYAVRTGRDIVDSFNGLSDDERTWWENEATRRTAMLRGAAVHAVRRAVHKAISTGVAE